jgi:hypothetical protein
MRCYYHPNEREAVALCTNCSRGLCSECATPIENGTACANRCEAEARAIKEVIERGKTGYQKAASSQMRNAILYLLLSAVTALIGALTLPSGWVMIGLGLVFLIGAVFSYSSARRLERVSL